MSAPAAPAVTALRKCISTRCEALRNATAPDGGGYTADIDDEAAELLAAAVLDFVGLDGASGADEHLRVALADAARHVFDLAAQLAAARERIRELEAAALPDIDMAALKHPHYDEWTWGEGRLEVTVHPDGLGHLAQLRGALTRDELLPAAAVLAWAFRESSPEALDARYACDCSPVDGEPCESYCASHDRPEVAS